MDDQDSVPAAAETGGRLAASFRDPAGFMFKYQNTLYRQVNIGSAGDYEQLIESGLYDRLTALGWLVTHDEVQEPIADASLAYRILCPERLHFISYPYEWSFSQIKDAAILTLDIQLMALTYGMTLSDASAFNIQFCRGHPIMIDTLSFEAYEEGRPWIGYRQFCQHFLAPLALMANTDIRLNQLLRVYLDGIPLDLASRLLPRRTWMSPGLALHLHAHARTQKAWASTDKPIRGSKSKSRFDYVSKRGLVGMLEGLRNAVHRLDWQPGGTEWADYYQATNYSDAAFDHKRRSIGEYLESLRPTDVWDLGANTGEFSRIATDMGIPTVAFDIDPAAVEMNYRRAKEKGDIAILPLLMDLSNPSPGIGWNEAERDSFIQRGPTDCALALALIHHLAISNNVPLARIANFFGEICRSLVIEFVPKEDAQVQRLLRSRKDIFEEYDREHFEQAFCQVFSIKSTHSIEGSDRVLYLMEKR